MQIISLVLIIIIGFFSYKISCKKITQKDITKAAVMITISVLLDILSISIPVLGFPAFKLSFSFIPLILMGVIVNPFLAFFSAIIVDVIALLISGGTIPYLGFTLNTVLIVFLSCLIFKSYNKIVKSSILKYLYIVFVSVLVIQILINDTFYLIGNEYSILLIYRIIASVFFILLALLIRLIDKSIKKKLTDPDLFHSSFLTNLVTTVLISLVLNPLWLDVIFNIPFKLSLFLRIFKAIITIPLFTTIIYKIQLFLKNHKKI